MKYYPVFLDLKGRACLVVGGGPVAERKARSLLASEGSVTIVSPRLSPALRDLAAEKRLVVKNKNFDGRDLDGIFLVIAATDDHNVNKEVAALCGGKGVLVNTATSPDESSFIVPSVVERGELLIAVSTSGASPALARKVRERLEDEFGPEYAALLGALGRLRARMQSTVSEEATRKRIFQAVVDSDALRLFRSGDGNAAEALIRELVDRELGKGTPR